ncbi:MAG TPA: acetyl-coenzyme A synthetase N-terminal domain-containing protein, partial [Trebonia sp.]|nr:acetyl-coenzyme A synthetase N-terminal domain-containing protein [Trebonia sp.]
MSADAHSADMPASRPAVDIDPLSGPVKAGDLLWTPSPERVANANITAFIGWLKQTRNLDFAGYPELWDWSVTDTGAFWQAVWDWGDIVTETPPAQSLARSEMPGAEWFPGARLNYAQN